MGHIQLAAGSGTGAAGNCRYRRCRASRAEDTALICVHPEPGRLRFGYSLICAGLALYGGWYWFGGSGLALVGLWLQASFAAVAELPESPVCIDLSCVKAVRIDPWRVSVRSTSSQATGLTRLDLFRDELDSAQWSRLRRTLLNSISDT